jgi:twinkle protein
MELIADNIDFEAYAIDRGDHANVKAASTYLDDMIVRSRGGAEISGCTLPWGKTHDLVRLRKSEVTIWPGINGHGKSMVVGQVMLGLMGQGEKVCIASFEMKPVATLTRMCRQAVGSDQPSEDFIRRFSERSDGKLWMYDQQGTVHASRVLGVIYYAAEELGVTQFVIDSLMKCGINEDDYNGQKKFIDQLCAAAKDTGCHIHLIAHSRKAHDELAPPGKMDVKGSGSITDQVDNILTVWRNKKKEGLIASGKASEDDKLSPDALIICDKQRHGEWEGRISLWFDGKSFRYLESPNQKVWQMES